jgi:cbb3-type cytochrome oxidase subunit 3
MPHSGFSWALMLFAIVALLVGIWAWSARGSAQPANAAVRTVLLTDATAPAGKGKSLHVESTLFVTRARTWTAYWSYYCLIPGIITQWHTTLWLVRVRGNRTGPPRLLYSARSSNGPVSYTEFFRESGPGTFRFIVDTTRHCVWSLRAPPVANRATTS